MNKDELTIQPDYEADFTAKWENRKHPDIFPAVYQRYDVPTDQQECEQQIEDLTNLVVAINQQYHDVRAGAFNSNLHPSKDMPTKARLKTIKSARNRYEAVRKAYIHWLAVEQGEPELVPVTGVSQISNQMRIETVASGLMQLIDIYISDLNGECEEPEEVLDKAIELKRKLAVMFTI